MFRPCFVHDLYSPHPVAISLTRFHFTLINAQDAASSCTDCLKCSSSFPVTSSKDAASSSDVGGPTKQFVD